MTYFPDDEAKSPYGDERAHLMPLLEALQQSGNLPVSHWFLRTEDGRWGVWLRQRLDMSLVRGQLARDVLGHEVALVGHDELHCRHCSVSIYGAGAG